MDINKYMKATQVIRRATKKNLDLLQIDALLHLYESEEKGLAVGELAEMVGLSHVAISRTMRLFSKHGANDYGDRVTGGWNLGEYIYDHERPRHRIMRLNKKGRKLVEDFMSALA